MSKTVDERVVSMQFDNKNFENNVQTSLNTLDKLKQSLNLTGASKGLENVDAAAKKVNISGLRGAIETVHTKFSALEVMGVTALANITNSAVNAGKRIASALTIDPIKTGFQEYETQINAVQTILANTESKGTTLQQVNSALDTLNTYADKTIYNFTEMTRNIGTFTAAGVDLETSVSAIKGIANLAAVSGSTSQQASTAMYQLSQALSSGTVKLQDWNSVVNAGMGGQVFQDALKQTARVHGVAIDQMIEEEGSFRETLQNGWLTSDILTETLNNFTLAAEEGSDAWNTYKKSLMDKGYTEEQASSILKMANTATDAATKVKTFTQLWDTLKESAQSGWAQSWEIIVGDFEEAKNFLTDVSNRVGELIGEAADARNEMLSGGLSSGWKQLLNEGIADEEGYKETLKTVAKEHGVSIDDMIAAEKKLDDSLTDTEAFQKALKTGFKDGSLSSDILTESVHKMANEMSKMSDEELKAAGYTADNVAQIKELSKGLKDGSISMDEFSEKISRNSGRENIIQALWNAFDGLMSVIKPVQEALKEIFPPTTGEQLYSFTQTLLAFSEKLKISGETADKIKRVFKGIFSIFDIGVQYIKAVAGGFKTLITYLLPAGGGFLSFSANIGDSIVKIRDFLKESDIFNKVVGTIVNIIIKAVEAIKSFVNIIANSEAFSSIKNAFAIVKDYISDFVSKIAEAFKDVANVDTSGFDNFVDKLKNRFAPLAALGEAVSNVFSFMVHVLKKAAPIFTAIATKIGEAFRAIQERIGSAVKDADYSSFFDLLNGGIFSAIGIYIAKFVKSAGSMLDNAGGMLENIKEILGGVGDALNAFTESIKSKTLKNIAISIGILAASLLVISLIDSEKLAGSIAIITALFAELMGSMTIFGKIADGKKFDSIGRIARAMIGLSAALLILAIAMKIMSTMTWEEMGIGLISITVGLGVLVTAVNLLPEKKVNAAAKAIKKLSTALFIFAVAMKIMGSMTWEEMAIGLITTIVGLGALVTAVNLLPAKRVTSSAKAIRTLSVSLVIFAAAMKIMGSMSWEEIAKGLITTVGGLTALVAAVRLLPKNSALRVAGMLGLATAVVVLGAAMKIMATMSWDEIARGLVAMAGGLASLVISINLLPRDAVLRAAGLIGIASAMIVLGAALKIMGSMSWEEIGRSLVVLAGAFTVLGLAGLILKPLVPTILALSGAITLLGIGVFAIGAGIMAFAGGLALLSVSGAAAATAIVAIVSSLIGLIPYFIKQVGVGIIELCNTIAGSVDAICGAFTTIIVALMDAIVTSGPAIVDGFLKLISEVLESLAKYTPKIVDSLFTFVIGVIDGLARNIPDFIKAIVNLIGALISGVIDVLSKMDPDTILKNVLCIGILTGLMYALASVGALTGPAMVGVLGLGAVVAELAAVLAAIGGLAQIPGLEWLISEGGELLRGIGKAIGGFVGGIIGGVMEGITASLPQVGTDLSNFMTNLQPFIAGATSLNPSSLEGAKALTEIILCLTGASILESITSWLTGGSSLTKFAAQLIPFGAAMVAFSTTVAGRIDESAVTAAANAGKTMAEMQATIPNSGGVFQAFTGEQNMEKFGEQLLAFGKAITSFSSTVAGNIDESAVTAAANAGKTMSEMQATIPNSGGVVQFFTGDQNMAKFGEQLVSFGESITKFSTTVAGNIDETAVTAAANAGKTMSEMQSTLPNSGGVIQFFTGEPNMATFGERLVIFGEAIKTFSSTVSGNIDESAVTAAANAGKTMSEMQSTLPNSGGVVQFFTGEQDMAKFGEQLVVFGDAMKKFSASVSGNIDESAVTAAANAGKALADMTSYIPNSGGVVSWFTGEQSISKFGEDLITLGRGLKGFSTEVSGVDSESMIAAANAGKALAEMTSYIPNEGGVAGWFSGESGVAKFGKELIALGAGIMGFSMATVGIDVPSVTAAANVCKTLAEMTSYIPNEGGVVSWFTGESSISKFASELWNLGIGLSDFSRAIVDVDSEKVKIAVEAAKTIAELTSVIPNSGGIAQWFAGEQSLSKFGDEIGFLGMGLNDFSLAIKDVEPEKVAAAANAAKTIGEMTQTIPNQGGIESWFSGEKSISAFAGELKNLGDGINNFSLAVEDVSPDKVTAAANAAKTLAEMTTTVPEDTSRIVGFGENVKVFGGYLLSYFRIMSDVKSEWVSLSDNTMNAINKFVNDINPEKVSSASDCIKNLLDAIEGMSVIKGDTTEGFTKAMKNLGETNISAFIKAFEDSKSKLNEVGKSVLSNFTEGVNSNKEKMGDSGKSSIGKFIEGVNGKKTDAKTAFENVVKACKSAISDYKDDFKIVGKNLVSGFADGISENTYKVEAQAKAMAEAAEKAAREVLDINSPSKVFRKIGGFVPEGFAQGIDRLSGLVRNSAEDMARDSVNSTLSAVSYIADVINSDIDAEPTIRPVLDLTNVRSGANAISGLLSGRRTLSINTDNVGSISASMSRRQNGNDSSEIVSSIRALRDDIANMPRNSYVVNGVTYDDGSNISTAVKDLVRAARIERRI